jgi:glycosyltransferase involved in cell wall biosynthesis
MFFCCPLKIGFLINTCEPFYRGGYERRTWSMARELARQGHDVLIYTSCPRDEMIDGVRFVKLAPARPYFNSRGVRNGWADLLFTLGIASLFWRLRVRDLDILDICATPFLHLPLAAFLVRSKKIPALLTCHEALLIALPSYARERGHRGFFTVNLFSQVLALIYRFGMGLFPQRLAVSKRTSSALAKEGFPSAHTIEFGLEPEAFCPQPPTASPNRDSLRVVFCGRLTPIKSLDVALQALLPLRTEAPCSFHFDVIGDGSERERLEQMTRDAGATDVVTFHGEVSEQRKLELLRQGEVFLLSSPREGFSIATLEAMAQGCVALVVNDPQNPSGVLDFVSHEVNGIVVPPDARSLQQALSRLIHDGQTTLQLRQAAWQRAHDYRIEEQARLLAEAYATVVV